jgi:hypothetical protein
MSHSAIAHVTDVTGRNDVILNLKKKKNPFSFFRLVERGGSDLSRCGLETLASLFQQSACHLF